jgi:hypothetical protein
MSDPAVYKSSSAGQPLAPSEITRIMAVEEERRRERERYLDGRSLHSGGIAIDLGVSTGEIMQRAIEREFHSHAQHIESMRDMIHVLRRHIERTETIQNSIISGQRLTIEALQEQIDELWAELRERE